MIRRLGRYELLDLVGSGGMAAVYRGRDTALDREVAVKLLHPHLAASAEARARFSREARAVARLSHPSILEIFDYSGDDAPECYLVTEFIRGRTLRAYAAEVGFGHPEVALLVGRALADALVHAHSAGVIHRDLKPENVLVQEGARPAVKLADFGIARIIASDERMTMTGALVGSPHHMAPEIIEGKEADARSDLFSLGTLLYWLATERLPFAASNPTAILRRVVEGDFEDPRAAEPRVPDDLATLVARLLAVEPGRRPQSAAEVREAIDRILAEVRIERAEDDLAAFLCDPAGYKAAFVPRAVAALTAQGDAAAREGATARALGFYDRVLAIDPANRDVPVILARLNRRRRMRRLFRSLVATAGALAAAWGVGMAVRTRQPAPHAAALDPATTTSTTTSTSTSTATPTTTSTAAEDGSWNEAVPGNPLPPPAHAVRARPRTPPLGPPAILSVHVRPYAQRALLDGVEVARGEQHVRFELSRGRPHRLQIEHACCAPFVRDVTAEEAEQVGELRVPLEPRPARIRVEGDPTARVYVDGKYLGVAGESQRVPFTVPVPAGGESPYEATAEIGLEPPGGAPHTAMVKLRAGIEVVVATPQQEVTP